MSGRALMARQEQGLNELGPTFDNFRQWQLDVYRAIWCRIRQFWTAEKWIRVTDDERNVKFVGLNAPITLGEQLIEEAKAQGQKVPPDMEQRAKMMPELQRVVGTRNNVTEMDVDIVLDTVPASASLQIEQFQALADLAGKGVPIPPDALIEASNLRNKDKILEKMGGKQGEIPPQAQQALQQAAQEIQMLRAELQKAQSGAQTAVIKAQSDAQVATIKADAARDQTEIKVAGDLLKAGMTPPPQLSAEVSSDLAK